MSKRWRRRACKLMSVVSLFLASYGNAAGVHAEDWVRGGYFVGARRVEVSLPAAPSSLIFSNGGAFGTQRSSASNAFFQIPTTSTVNSGALAVCAIAIDNDGDGNNTNDVLTATDTRSNTWTIDGEAEVDPAAGAAGAVVAIAWSHLTTTLQAGDTVYFNFATAKIAKGGVCQRVDVSSSAVTISTFSTVQRSTNSVDPLEMTMAVNQEYAVFRTIGTEGTDGLISAASPGGWQVLLSSGHNSGTNSSSMHIGWEMLIASGTVFTSTPTVPLQGVDRVSSMIAIGHTP